jgi:cyclopropane fatty-acyl-phospholipid synthase-like methyltransferase
MITGRVLDIGCGDGRNSAYLARLGFEVIGVDFSADAVSRARILCEGIDNAPRIYEANIFTFGQDQRFDTIIDCAFFHGLFDEERRLYVDTLDRLCASNGVVHIIALADVDPGLGPRISERALREPFGQGWELLQVDTTIYRSRIPAGASEQLGFPVEEGSVSDTTAWLATVRRST